MNVYEAFDFWHDLEDKFPVDRWQINGISIWPLIRIQLGFMSSAYQHNEKGNSLSKWIRYRNKIAKLFNDRINLLINDNKHCQKLCRADLLFMRDMCGRNVVLPDGTLFDHNIDPLQYKLQKNGFVSFNFEQVGNIEPRLPRWSNSFLIDSFILRCILKKNLYKYIKKKVYQVEKYDEFLEKLSLHGVDVSIVSLENLANRVLFISNMSNWFEKKLMAIKPRVVILTCWYSDEKMALALAAHKLNIPVIEVQHGIAAGGRCHPQYYTWMKMPDNGYELMPDYMWVWDKSDYDEMIPWATNSMRPFIGGHPMNLIWSDTENKLSHYYQEKYEQEYGFDKPTILVTLQWGSVYPQWFIDYINEHEEYNWLIRLHPVVDDYERDFMKKIYVRENIKKDSPATFPLEILLKNVNLHVTLSSSVVLDAVAFGCHSIVMNDDGINKYGKQLDSGMASYAGNRIDFHYSVQKIILNNDPNKDNRSMENLRDVGNYAISQIIEIARNSSPAWEIP